MFVPPVVLTLGNLRATVSACIADVGLADAPFSIIEGPGAVMISVTVKEPSDVASKMVALVEETLRQCVAAGVSLTVSG